jgi:hypothetical protein
MKLFKLTVRGNKEKFEINYSSSANYVDYKDCSFTGSEQEKYNLFLTDLQKNSGPLPINVKVKMTTQTTDRAFLPNDILQIKDVNDFIKRLAR